MTTGCAERGPATGQACAECGGTAAVWSYDGTELPFLVELG